MEPEFSSKIFVSGHRGLVGRAVCKALSNAGYRNILTATRQSLDLTEQRSVYDYFAANQPDAQVVCAATVGGIVANSSYPADFIGGNLIIQANLLEAARLHGCQRTILISSGCIYPRDAANPIGEEALLSAPLEETNQWYAVAKIAGLKMGQAYRRQHGLEIVSLLPCNLYGEHDNFDDENSHVVPGLMQRAHLAKTAGAPQLKVWGSGRAKREFMHADDLAVAVLLMLKNADIPEYINIGSGEEVSIAKLASLICKVVGYDGELEFDSSRPDGNPAKLLDSTRMHRLFDWRPQIDLAAGLARTYAWYCQQTQLRTSLNLGG